MENAKALQSLLRDSIAAHTLRFEHPLAPAYGNDPGLRIVAAFLAVGIAMPFALRLAFDAAGGRGPSRASLSSSRGFAHSFSRTGGSSACPLPRWACAPFGDWTRRERLYFFQVIPLAAVAFAVIFRAHLRAARSPWARGIPLLLRPRRPPLGNRPEIVYRGWLQTQLTPAPRPPSGPSRPNVVFTFGPLRSTILSTL